MSPMAIVQRQVRHLVEAVRGLPRSAVFAIALGSLVIGAAAAAYRGGEPADVLGLTGTAVVTVSSAVHDASHATIASAAIGSAIHQSVTVVPPNIRAIPTGGVQLQLWTNATCSAPVYAAATYPLGHGLKIDGSGAVTIPPGVTVVSMRARYLGDATFAAANGPCQKVNVTLPVPTVKTIVHDASHAAVSGVAAGTMVHPVVEVSGALGTAAGSVAVRWYMNPTCAGELANDYSPTLALSGGKVDASGFAQKASATSSSGQSFRATYYGSSTYASASGPCVSYAVTKLPPTFDAYVHDAAHHATTEVPFGSTVHPAVSVTGSQPVSGTVDAELWFFAGCPGSPDGKISVQLASAGSVEFSSGMAVSAPAMATYSYRVTFRQSAYYQDTTSACLPISWKVQPTISLAAHDAAHNSVLQWGLGESVHPIVLLTGSAGVVSGSVKVTTYQNGSCSIETPNVSVTSVLSNGQYHPAGTTVPPGVTTVSYRATYLGNATYLMVTSNCLTIPVEIGPQ